MSDTMLLGVLRMPIADGESTPTLRQFINRARQAADRIEADAARIAELEAEVATLRFQSDALQSAATQLVDLADKRDRLRIEVLILRDSCAAKADRIDRLGETVVRLSATLKVAGEALRDARASLHGHGYNAGIIAAVDVALRAIKEAQR